MILKVTRIHRDAKLPSRSTDDSASFNLYACENATIQPHSWCFIRTGISVLVPPLHEGHIRPKTGIATRLGITVLSAHSTIDSDNTDEILVPLINHGEYPWTIMSGDRIAHFVIVPVVIPDVEEIQLKVEIDEKKKRRFPKAVVEK